MTSLPGLGRSDVVPLPMATPPLFPFHLRLVKQAMPGNTSSASWLNFVNTLSLEKVEHYFMEEISIIGKEEFRRGG